MMTQIWTSMKRLLGITFFNRLGGDRVQPHPNMNLSAHWSLPIAQTHKHLSLTDPANRLHTVQVGDKIDDDVLVEDIQEKRVILQKKGDKTIILDGGHLQFSNF